MLVRIQSSALCRDRASAVAEPITTLAALPGEDEGRRRSLNENAVWVRRIASQSSKLRDGVRFLDTVFTARECGGFARDPAKVEDQVRFLNRLLT